MGRVWAVLLGCVSAVVMFAGIATIVGAVNQPERPPPEPTPAELQRQNAALRDSLEAERGWDTTPPGFIREICEAEDG